MKAKDIRKDMRAKSPGEMTKDLAALREKVRELRFKIHAQELKNPKEISRARKDIARLMTIMGEIKESV